MADIEIFSANACPYAQRTRFMLTEKGVPFSLTEIDLRNKPAWFKDVSPYGKVPVIRHRGQVIYESAIINEYLEEVFPEPPLMPGTRLNAPRCGSGSTTPMRASPVRSSTC